MRTGFIRLGVLGSVVTTAAFVTFLTVPQSTSADPLYDSYVALGDSFTAGPGITPTTAEACARSGRNYPALVAEGLGIANFVDVSCSAAESVDLTGTQTTVRGEIVPAQYDALTPDADLVTVGVGGNDIGLVRLAASCINLFAPPNGRSCAETNSATGIDPVDAAIDEFAPRFSEITDEIRQRSPHARIVFVGYPTGIRDGGCFPEQWIWPQDATYLQDKIDRLNAVMEQQVVAAGAEYVDLSASSAGHDACAAPGERWMEGVIPAEAIPMHPNASGHRNAADQVLISLAG